MQGGIACGTGSRVPLSRPAAPRMKTSSAIALCAPKADLKLTSYSPRALCLGCLGRHGRDGCLGSDREALRQVAIVAVQAVEAQSADRILKESASSPHRLF